MFFGGYRAMQLQPADPGSEKINSQPVDAVARSQAISEIGGGPFTDAGRVLHPARRLLRSTRAICHRHDSCFIRKSRPASGKRRSSSAERDMPPARGQDSRIHSSRRLRIRVDGRIVSSGSAETRCRVVFQLLPAARAVVRPGNECCQRRDTRNVRTTSRASGSTRSRDEGSDPSLAVELFPRKEAVSLLRI